MHVTFYESHCLLCDKTASKSFSKLYDHHIKIDCNVVTRCQKSSFSNSTKVVCRTYLNPQCSSIHNALFMSLNFQVPVPKPRGLFELLTVDSRESISSLLDAENTSPRDRQNLPVHLFITEHLATIKTAIEKKYS